MKIVCGSEKEKRKRELIKWYEILTTRTNHPPSPMCKLDMSVNYIDKNIIYGRELRIPESICILEQS